MTELERLYAVTEADHEVDFLDQLAERAGLVWTCHGPHAEDQPSAWTNPGGIACEICKREPHADQS